MAWLKTFKFWELAFTVAALVFALFLYYVDAWIRQKDPVVKILSQNNLINHRNKADKDSISVLFEDATVDNFAFIRIRLQNRGLTIDDKDFREDISLNLKHVKRIFFVNIGDTFPDRLNPKVRFADHTINISPVLLNKGEYFNMEIGADLDGDQKVVVLPTSRIVGASISVDDKRRNKPRIRNIEYLWNIIPFLLVIPAYFLGSWIERTRGKTLTKLGSPTSEHSLSNASNGTFVSGVSG